MTIRRPLLLSVLCSVLASNAWAEPPEPRLWCYDCQTSTAQNPDGTTRLLASCVREIPGGTGQSTCQVRTTFGSSGQANETCDLGGVSCSQTHYPGDLDGCQPSPPGGGGGPPFEHGITPGEPQVTRNGQPAGSGR